MAEIVPLAHALSELGRGNEYYQAWNAISRDRDTFQRWLDEEVDAAASA